ncbi:hypothetical protein CB1_001056015 [Camelus ferus]|nr:hypothetical protein CB1_001056015 [Camelus ferus]
MESQGPWMPGPGLFLLLLLPFPLLSAGSFKHSVLDRRNFRHFDINLKDIYNYFSREWRDLKKGKSKKLYDCNGAFDLYFVLDASSGVGDKWKDICKLVESMVKWYTNPKLRMSFITYSNYGNVLLRLTSDRGQQPILANEEIARVFYSNKKAASLIFTVTAGPLLPTDLRKSKSELIQIVAGKTQMYEIPQIPDNEGFLISLVGNSCKEVMGGDTFYACVGGSSKVRVTAISYPWRPEPYQLGFFAYGLIQSKIPDYACRYNLDKTEVYITTILTTTTVTTVVTEPEVVPEEETTVAIIVTESPVPSSPLLCLALIPSLLMIPLLLVCICCCKRALNLA